MKSCHKWKSCSDDSEDSSESSDGKNGSGKNNNGRNSNGKNSNGKNNSDNKFVVVGKYAGATYPAISSKGSCSYFIDGKVRTLNSCSYLENESIRWVSSSNGKIEIGAVVIDNIALGRASLKKGAKWIGRIISSPSFSGLIYSDGVLEYKTNEYEALVCSC